jgi:cbb3-type cytochrome oxidase subunit 3
MNAFAWIDSVLLLFGMVVFIAILLATYWPGRRDSIERNAQIPFHDKT